MSEPHASNTLYSNEAEDSNSQPNDTAKHLQGNATFVDKVLDPAARQFRSQSNGRNTNTSNTEALQAASAEDSNSNDRGDLDPQYSFCWPLTPAMGFVQPSHPARPTRTSDGTGQKSAQQNVNGTVKNIVGQAGECTPNEISGSAGTTSTSNILGPRDIASASNGNPGRSKDLMESDESEGVFIGTSASG